MCYMFYGCKAFKQNISGWDVSSVNDRCVNLMFDPYKSIDEKFKPTKK